MKDPLLVFNYLLIGTTAIMTIGYLGYAIYLIVLNEEQATVDTRKLGLYLLFLPFATFFSGITFVHYFIEKYPFLQFLLDYSKQIGLVFWFGVFISGFYMFLEVRYLKKLKKEAKREIKLLENLKRELEKNTKEV